MFEEDSTDPGFGDLTPTELNAARGQLPEWARVTPRRREHIKRVATLLEEWAHALGLPEHEALRWAAAGWLHDVVRDAPPAELIRDVPPELRDLPGPLLHGPAAATRLDFLVAPSVRNAVRYHTIGHPTLDDLGRALYLADFLEPGRDFANEWREQLRASMPAGRDEALRQVVASRINHLLESRKPIRPETAAFWSSLVAEGRG
jgi:HD superfamily phosphohydrolase YqeK